MTTLQIIINALPTLLGGLRWTIEYSVLGIGLSIVVGTCSALMSLSHHRVVRIVAKSYVELFRGTPLLGKR